VLQQHEFRAGRYRITYQACNDSRPNEGADPALCAANARAYALDTSMIGVMVATCTADRGVECGLLE
jgi:hypothetical protein